MLNMKVKVKKFATYARIPQKATLVSAGFDLYSARFLLLEAQKLQKIETDIAFHFLLNSHAGSTFIQVCL